MQHFYSYRYNAFNLAINDIFKQLQQFMLMLVTLFYIFLPGLIAGLFFGLGKIVQSSSPVISMQVALAYLIFQSLLLTVLKPAILDSCHRSFHTTLLKGKFPQLSADIIALVVCHIPLFLSCVLMFSMGLDKLSRAPHFAVFALTQLSFAVMLMYRQTAVIWASVLGFMLFFVCDSVTGFLLSLNGLLLASLFLPERIAAQIPLVMNSWTIWLSFFKQNIWALCWRGTMSGLVFWAVLIIVTERPDLIHWYVIGGVVLNQLWWSSFLIETSQFVKTHRLYWQSLDCEQGIKSSQYVYLVAFASLFTLPIIMLFMAHWAVWASLLVTPIVIALARKHTQYLAVVWACCAISLIMGMVFFSTHSNTQF